MEPREKRRMVISLTVIGLFVAAGLTGPALGAVATTGEPAYAHPSHIHPVSGAEVVLSADLPAALAHEATDATTDTNERLAFQDEMRKLWEDHVTWTRLYIVSAAADLPDQELTAQRLLRNQADIGNAIKPFYGEEAGNELTKLLEEHILGAADLLAAAKTGDQTAVEVAGANWYANADAIAAFLSAANPDSWPLADLQAEMRMHLDLTLEEATARLNGDFAADIAAYDEVHEHILAFADLLSSGIIERFPDRFA